MNRDSFRAALIGPTRRLPKRRRLCLLPREKPETLRVRNVSAMRLGAWLRSGEGIGWPAAGTIPNSLYRVPSIYLFLACAVIVYLVWDRVGSSGESESIEEYTIVAIGLTTVYTIISTGERTTVTSYTYTYRHVGTPQLTEVLINLQ